MGPGNGILRAETGGRLQAQNAGERPEFGSQTAPRPANCSPGGISIPTISASALSTPLPISKLVCDAAKDMLVDGLKMKTAVIMSEDAAWTTPLDAGYVACLPKIGLNVLDNPPTPPISRRSSTGWFQRHGLGVPPTCGDHESSAGQRQQ